MFARREIEFLNIMYIFSRVKIGILFHCMKTRTKYNYWDTAGDILFSNITPVIKYQGKKNLVRNMKIIYWCQLGSVVRNKYLVSCSYTPHKHKTKHIKQVSSLS